MAFEGVFNRQGCEVNLTVRADTNMAISEAILICGVLYWAEWIGGNDSPRLTEVTLDPSLLILKCWPLMLKSMLLASS